MLDRKFDLILEECLERMDRGDSLGQIIAAYPRLEKKLKPLLLVAMAGRSLPAPLPSYTSVRLGKNLMLSEMALMKSQGVFLKPVSPQPPRKLIPERWGESTRRLQPAFRFATLGIILVFAGGFFTLSASASELTDQVIRSLFFNFEQVGELLRINPEPGEVVDEGIFLKNDYELPGDPGENQGGVKGPVIGYEENDPVPVQEKSPPSNSGNQPKDKPAGKDEEVVVEGDEIIEPDLTKEDQGIQDSEPDGETKKGNNGNHYGHDKKEEKKENNENQGQGNNGNHYGYEKKEEKKENNDNNGNQNNNKNKDKEKEKKEKKDKKK